MNLNSFRDQEQASRAVSEFLAEKVKRQLSVQSGTSMIVSGGNTPRRCFEMLSESPLAWDRVSITLSDERCVPVEDDASNERLIREYLLRNKASTARFIPLEEEALHALPLPPAVALLGMGEDGHFASIFPDLPDLQVLLDPGASRSLASVHTSVSTIERITLTLAYIAKSLDIALLVFGAPKLQVIEQPGNRPVSSLLSQQLSPVTVFWAP